MDLYYTYKAAGVTLMRGLSSLNKDDGMKLTFDINVEPYINWLQNIVNQCNNYNEVMKICNNRMVSMLAS